MNIPLKELQLANELPPLPIDYIPNSIEFFDQVGLLAGIVEGKLAFSYPRKPDYQCNYLAVYLDGQLSFFYLISSNKILLNRLNNLAISYLLRDEG
jgi:hypothetical protein